MAMHGPGEDHFSPRNGVVMCSLEWESMPSLPVSTMVAPRAPCSCSLEKSIRPERVGGKRWMEQKLPFG